MQSLGDAVELAHMRAQRGDIVTLSPACAAFDQFKKFYGARRKLQEDGRGAEMSAGRKAGGQLALKKVRSVCEKAVSLKRSLSHPYCAAVIVAAGSASRMEGTDKIFTLLDRLPVICRTVEAFQKCSLIDEIVLVTRPEKLERLSRLCPAYPKVRMVVPGGETRLGSVLAGLRAVSVQTQLVAVQDGARPLVSEKVISAAVVQAGRCGAAAPAVPVKDTIKGRKRRRSRGNAGSEPPLCGADTAGL